MTRRLRVTAIAIGAVAWAAAVMTAAPEETAKKGASHLKKSGQLLE